MAVFLILKRHGLEFGKGRYVEDRRNGAIQYHVQDYRLFPSWQYTFAVKEAAGISGDKNWNLGFHKDQRSAQYFETFHSWLS